ncbi:MAG: hypothetical protein U9N19_04640 [Thermodesulfobacteriota bacterium]|nr:hypothetical protein [Thermodesulfobacteriota bacterium]
MVINDSANRSLNQIDRTYIKKAGGIRVGITLDDLGTVVSGVRQAGRRLV